MFTCQEYVLSQLNVRTVTYTTDERTHMSTRAEPEYTLLGPRLGKNMSAAAKAIAGWSEDAIRQFIKDGKGQAGSDEVTKDEVKLIKAYKGDTTWWVIRDG